MRLDLGILRVSQVAGHRCTGCKLIFFDYAAAD